MMILKLLSYFFCNKIEIVARESTILSIAAVLALKLMFMSIIVIVVVFTLALIRGTFGHNVVVVLESRSRQHMRQ